MIFGLHGFWCTGVNDIALCKLNYSCSLRQFGIQVKILVIMAQTKDVEKNAAKKWRIKDKGFKAGLLKPLWGSLIRAVYTQKEPCQDRCYTTILLMQAR